MTDNDNVNLDGADNDNVNLDADADFLRRWLSRPDAADTTVRLPEDEFLRRWLTGTADENDND